eukprot:194783_1
MSRNNYFKLGIVGFVTFLAFVYLQYIYSTVLYNETIDTKHQLKLTQNYSKCAIIVFAVAKIKFLRQVYEGMYHNTYQTQHVECLSSSIHYILFTTKSLYLQRNKLNCSDIYKTKHQFDQVIFFEDILMNSNIVSISDIIELSLFSKWETQEPPLVFYLRILVWRYMIQYTQYTISIFIDTQVLICSKESFQIILNKFLNDTFFEYDIATSIDPVGKCRHEPYIAENGIFCMRNVGFIIFEKNKNMNNILKLINDFEHIYLDQFLNGINLRIPHEQPAFKQALFFTLNQSLIREYIFNSTTEICRDGTHDCNSGCLVTHRGIRNTICKLK